jgi:hypothetical protein
MQIKLAACTVDLSGAVIEFLARANILTPCCRRRRLPRCLLTGLVYRGIIHAKICCTSLCFISISIGLRWFYTAGACLRRLAGLSAACVTVVTLAIQRECREDSVDLMTMTSALLRRTLALDTFAKSWLRFRAINFFVLVMAVGQAL